MVVNSCDTRKEAVATAQGSTRERTNMVLLLLYALVVQCTRFAEVTQLKLNALQSA